MKHSHVMGGSTAARRINCIGSLKAEAAFNKPDKPPTEYAMRGTVLHAAMEMMLITLDPDAKNYLETYQQVLNDLEGNDLGYGEQWAITPEQINNKIVPAWEAFLEVKEKYSLDDWFIEQQVSLDDQIPGAFGTADLILKDTSNRLHILDWKFGDGVPVPVEGNMGLTFYAAAALYDPDPELIEFCSDVENVALHIVQPRVGSNKVLHTWETDTAYVENFIDIAEEAMTKARGVNPPLKPGDYCRWCNAQINCSAYKNMSSEVLKVKPEDLTELELSEALKKAELLSIWIKNVFEKAQQELEKGVIIPGYKLVNKKPRRAWKDVEAAEKALRSARFKVAKMFSKKLISPTQLEKEDKKLYQRIAKKHVHMHSSGVTVANDLDERPAVTSSMDLLTNALEKSDRKQEND